MSHLSDETFVDLLDGTVAESVVPHLQSCAVCRAQLADLRQTMEMATDADVPEPSPLFWGHMAARIRASVDEESYAPAPRGLAQRLLPSAFSWWGLGGLVGVAAAALLAVVLQMPRVTMTPGESTVSEQVLRTTEPDVADVASVVESDETLGFVADLASGVDWDADATGGFAAPGAVDRSVASLNADERAELGRLLHDALRGGA